MINAVVHVQVVFLVVFAFLNSKMSPKKGLKPLSNYFFWIVLFPFTLFFDPGFPLELCIMTAAIGTFMG